MVCECYVGYDSNEGFSLSAEDERMRAKFNALYFLCFQELITLSLDY